MGEPSDDMTMIMFVFGFFAMFACMVLCNCFGQRRKNEKERRDAAKEADRASSSDKSTVVDIDVGLEEVVDGGKAGKRRRDNELALNPKKLLQSHSSRSHSAINGKSENDDDDDDDDGDAISIDGKSFCSIGTSKSLKSCYYCADGEIWVKPTELKAWRSLKSVVDGDSAWESCGAMSAVGSSRSNVNFAIGDGEDDSSDDDDDDDDDIKDKQDARQQGDDAER